MSESRLVLPDVNVLVALAVEDHVFHHDAHRWFADVKRFATTPVTEAGLLRLLLNPRVVGQDLSTPQALGVLAGVRADPRAEFLVDDTTLADATVDTAALAGHQQVTDWHLLNLAAHHDAVLVTFDRKLARAAVPADAARVLTLGG